MIEWLVDFIADISKPNPENIESLLKIDPVRRYSHEEVVSLLALISGVVVDGLLIQGFSVIKETGYWYSVDVDYGDCTETWYFFKKEESKNANNK